MGNGSLALEGDGPPDVSRPAGRSLHTLFIPFDRPASELVPPKVTLVTEGTYPYYWGGVSTWCDSLVRGLPDVDFTVISIISDPNRRPLFELRSDTPIVTVPIWGTRQSFEIGSPGRKGAHIRRRGVPDAVLDGVAIPTLLTFLECLWSDEPDLIALEDSIGGLHTLFRTYGFDAVMDAPRTWQAVCDFSVGVFPAAASAAGYPDAPLAFSDVTRGFQIIRRWLEPLGLEFPPTDVVHAAMAGVCSLVAVAIKKEQGAAFFLTEHGIYLREALLSEARSSGSLFLKLLSLAFARRITELSYRIADQISPCCEDHKRWEFRLGAPRERVKTLYYGVDPSIFHPADRPAGRPPTVVWVGRIDPLKDVETLLRAAAMVRDARPDVRFRLFGSAPPGNEEYEARCLELHRDLRLDETVVFEGFTDSPADAFNLGDVALLTSISEGFPYSTLEAMLCGRPVVATGVGGLSEQVGDCGVIVEPRNPQAISRAVLEVLADPERLDRLSSCARQRSEQRFSLDGFLAAHRDVYERLVRGEVHELDHAHTLDDDVIDDVVKTDGVVGAGSGSFAPLEAALLERAPIPVDALEVTATLESAGVTSEVARRFGAADTFALADRVLPRLRSRATARPRPFDPDLDAVVDRRYRSPGAFLAGLVPALVVAILLTRFSDLDGDPEAVILGLLAGLIVSNGLLQGLTPRTSHYVGCENWAGLRKVVMRFWLAASASIVTIAAIGAAVAAVPDGLSRSTSAAIVSFGGISIFWVSTAGYAAFGRQERVAIAVVVGVAAGAATGFSAETSDLAALGVGYLATLVFVVVDTEWLFRAERARSQPLVGIPAWPALVREAVPFVGFGASSMVVLLAPHALVLFDSQGGLSNPAVFQYELAINLSLLPLLASAPYADRLVERFWTAIVRLQVSTPADDGPGFSSGVEHLVRWYGTRMASFLCLSTAAYLFVVEMILGQVGSGLDVVTDRSAFETTVILSSLAYLMLGWGLLQCGWLSSMAAPSRASWVAAAGAFGTVVAATALLGRGPLELGVLATAVGSAVLVIGSLLAMWPVVAEAGYRLAVRT